MYTTAAATARFSAVQGRLLSRVTNCHSCVARCVRCMVVTVSSVGIGEGIAPIYSLASVVVLHRVEIPGVGLHVHFLLAMTIPK